MKKKLIEKTPVPELKKKKKGDKYRLKVAEYCDGIIIDVYDKSGNYSGKYAMDVEKGEYKTYRNGVWKEKRFGGLVGREASYYSSVSINENIIFDTEEDKKILEKNVGSIFEMLRKESEYGKDKRVKAKENLYSRYREIMKKIPEKPDGFVDWVKKLEEKHYTFKDTKRKEYHCSACGYIRQIKKGPSHGAVHTCENCGSVTIVKSRTKKMERKGNVALMQRLDDTMSVVRHFSYMVIAELENTGEELIGAREDIYLQEDVRLIMHSSGGYTIFYNQGGEYREWWSGIVRPEWSSQNPQNKRMRECYLYPGRIEEALKGTSYEILTRAFTEMARMKVKGKYNEAMATGYTHHNLGNVLEYLCKGRFWKLLKETMEHCDVYGGNYYGILELSGRNEREVFGLEDRQKIFRIRQNNGGQCYLKWMRFEEREKKKLSDKFLKWAERERLDPEELEGIADLMSPEKVMNYIQKQKAYYPYSAAGIIEQWLDYLDMCRLAGKKTEDALFFAPKNLKQAHDSMVMEKEKLEIIKTMRKGKEAREERAEEMRKKFPEAQENLQYAAERYEYISTEYVMKIPRDLYEIVEEGAALHHCGGSTDRYFNRIANKETYIGFCRRVGEEGIPFYTIEFEPDGTIRQSRSLYDEEPNIEEIRGFLKEWQREVKKRMTEEDKMAAVRSAKLREENIKELKDKGNTFVLKKLMEDFLEAV